jgi:hypothetical protein
VHGTPRSAGGVLLHAGVLPLPQRRYKFAATAAAVATWQHLGGSGGGSVAAAALARRRWQWRQQGSGGRGSAAVAAAARQPHWRRSDGGNSVAAAVAAGRRRRAAWQQGGGDSTAAAIARQRRWRLHVGVSTKPAAARPTVKVRFAVDVEEVRARMQATERDRRAPIKMAIGWDQRAPIKMGSETTGKNARCSVGESVYSLSHF